MGSIETPAYGQRLLPVLVDEEAINNPDRIIFSLAKTTKAADGFISVSNKRFANAVNRAAWWLEKLLGKSKNFETVGYIGPGDIRYQILTLALAKTGYKILLNSPRNSVEGHLNVIQKADCNIWLLPNQNAGNIGAVLKAHPMNVLDCPDFEFFIDETPVPHYPYNKPWAELATEPLLVLHTSGSTGLPKPIIVRHALVGVIDAQNLLKAPEGQRLLSDYWPGSRVLSTFPAFHAAGTLMNFVSAIYLGLDIVFASPASPVTADLVSDMCDHADINGLMMAPSTAEEVAFTPSCLERIKNLDFLGFGGGPISKKAGDILSKVTTLQNVIGATEAALFSTIEPARENWQYFHYHPINGLSFVEQGNGLYEMMVVRDPKLALFQGMFHTFPELNEISTNDLYEKHPTIPDLWLYKGRADDIIVFSNGEKLNPITMEQTINEHPEVRSAIIVGQAHFQPAVIVELVHPIEVTEEKRKELVASIQPYIEEANKGAPGHGQLKDGFIIFASPSKPFARAGKGTVQRPATVRLYAPEIDELYNNAEAPVDSSVDTTSLESLTISVRDLIAKIANVEEIKTDVDIFATGSFDSLLVFTLLRHLRSALQNDGVEAEKLQPSSIYNHPTIESLASFLFQLAHPAEGEAEASQTNIEEMQQLFEKYTKDLPPKSSIAKEISSDISVILTGSTGSMGSYMLDDLLAMPHISRIYCLNRATNGEEKQRSAFKTHGLKHDDFSRVHFFKTDMSQPLFGLDQEQYTELLNNTTHIIHNQWPVDFNMSLASFEPHIRGVRNLIDFASQSTHDASLFFISSIGGTQGKAWPAPIPESLISDWSSPALGYGSSKHVCERILFEANLQSGVRTGVLRVGQVSGPVNKKHGRWNTQEWFPTIVASSRFMKCVPSTLGGMSRIDWVPVDVLCETILDLTDLREKDPERSHPVYEGTPFYHLVNPGQAYWSELVEVVVENINGEGNGECEVVEWEEWVGRLRESAERGEIKENRGIKLLEFYEGLTRGFPLAKLDTKRTVKKSERLGRLGPVSKEWLKLWLEQWGN